MNSPIHIPRCYDSHLHLLPTGEMAITLDLSAVKNWQTLRELELSSDYHRGPWLVGWGFEDHQWQDPRPWGRKGLDQIFPSKPISFSRRDGHVLWMNTEGFKAMNLWKPKSEWPVDLLPYVEFGSDQMPSGALKDRALDLVLFAIPPLGSEGMHRAFSRAFEKLRAEGFTHVREMMGNRDQWNLLRDWDLREGLPLYVEMNFHCPEPSQIEKTVQDLKVARSESSPHLRPGGVKLFVDGALGSSGAFLRRAYEGTQEQGTLLWSEDLIRQCLKVCFENQVPVALHTLGDGASWVSLRQAEALAREGLRGEIHLEHVEVFDDESVELARSLGVRCHIQPSHFLSDLQWLSQKLGDRVVTTFPWGRLEQAGVPFCFGSDTPIEPPELWRTRKGVWSSRELGVPPLRQHWTAPHIHPDPHWGPDCSTQVTEEGQVLKVVFDGQTVIQRK